jgi:HAD superfamily hydrolase (TIGR01509 family)
VQRKARSPFTIDFHNTLFTCDTWFQLEIRYLPQAVIELHDRSRPGSTSQEQIEHALQTYRAIREEAMASGVECDAVTSMIRVAEAIGLSITETETTRLVEQIMWDAQHDAEPIPGAAELLRTVRSSDVPIAVVSSAAYHPFLEWSLERYAMSANVDRIITSAACGIYKSDPAIYQHTLDLFNASASQSVHVGDSPRFDVASASKIGMRTVLLTIDTEARFDPAPDLMVRSLGEVPDHLDRLLGA